ncbi:MAG: LD-carboxypeptidase [Balneola sp.]|nr:LD-carboxypeptidase [Balneola sp.]MBO6650698.1 LD-carboxypeptidase [Balneola sp.]MBO6710610.1 LD-carboxypeptidase [Balneola sp.]MBO6799296.1 LD-carboxypeptidase [Balneola sp.]MBO6869575.1 LD-carboxypeptidase [Balneola sp.]
MSISRKQFLKNTGLASLGLAGLSKSSSNNEKTISNELILPKAISWNSTIGLVAPASPIYDSSQFDEMISTLNELGFNLKLGQHVQDQYGYLAGTDEDRAQDLMSMFTDPEVDAILCVRGGWGCNRIIDLLDYEIIKANPKPLIGFSDITSLHNALLSKTGLVSFHGPVGKSEWNSFTKNSFEEVLINKKRGVYELDELQIDAFTITKGTAEGPLLGGNLSVLVAMLGSDYLPSFDNAILFLEDVGEDVYRLDRMLTQLKLNGILDQISGFIFGKCTNCDAGSNSLTIPQLFDDLIKPLNIPAYYGAMISHEKLNVTIPVGIRARMNAEEMKFEALSSAVK